MSPPETTITVVMLTHHRKDSVEQSLKHNLLVAGYPVTDLVHVDNGSGPEFNEWFREEFHPKIQVIHRENEGVSKGYNRGLLLATTSHIVLLGCDRLMPEFWLRAMVEAFHIIPNTGVISCYSSPTEATRSGRIEERFNSHNYLKNGVWIREAQPCEARMHSRAFLLKTGFFREDFGLYGYEDVEWIDRANRVARECGLINYILPELGMAMHLPDEDGGESYKDFKRTQNDEPVKKEIVKLCWALNSPYYNPYVRFESDAKKTLAKIGEQS